MQMEMLRAIRQWTIQQKNDVATTLRLEVFIQKTLHGQKLNFTGKNSKITFCATLWGT